MYPELMVIPMREELTRAGLRAPRPGPPGDTARAPPPPPRLTPPGAPAPHHDGRGELDLRLRGRQDAPRRSPRHAARHPA